MQPRLVSILALSAIAILSAPSAHADTNVDKAKRVGKKLLIGEWTDAKGLMYSIGAGWEDRDRVGVVGQIGYAWGRQKTGLTNAASMHHISIGPHLFTPAGETDVSVDAAVMIGHTWRAFAHFGVEAGATIRITPDAAVGPLFRVRGGYKGVGLYVYSGARFADETDFIAGAGVELFKLPSLSAVQSLVKTVPTL